MPDAIEGQSSTIRVEVDAALKAKWEANKEKISEAQRGGAESFIVLWKSVTEVVESTPPLYLAAGFVSATAFAEKFLKVPMRTAKRNMEVARVASRAEVERYGISKLDSAVNLLSVDTPSFDKIRVAVERKGKPSKVSIEEANIDEIRLAVRNLRPKKPGPIKSRNPAAALLNKAMTDGKLKGVTVVLARSGITFRGLGLEDLQSLAGILARVKLPGSRPVLRRVA